MRFKRISEDIYKCTTPIGIGGIEIIKSHEFISRKDTYYVTIDACDFENIGECDDLEKAKDMAKKYLLNIYKELGQFLNQAE